MDINEVIPADKWPEWADRHCWDEDGCVAVASAKPAGHDRLAGQSMPRTPFTCGHKEGSWTIQRPSPRIGIGKALAAAAGLLALAYVVGHFI